MEIIAFTKENTDFEELPEEDSFEYTIKKDKIIVAVADGITRDPIGVKLIPHWQEKEAMKSALRSYPKPSPAKIAADTFCEQFLSYVYNTKKIDDTTVTDAFTYANKRIRALNKKNIEEVDYLENDFWACVASAGIIQNNKLFWSYICDCGVCVFDKNVDLRFRTQNDMLIIQNYAQKHNIDTKKSPLWRREIREKFRNNLFNNVDGKLISYGALTGENIAIKFVRAGKIILQKGDYVLFYSDGMEPIIFSEEFKQNLLDNKLSGLEEFCRELADKRGYGVEGTLVAVLVK